MEVQLIAQHTGLVPGQTATLGLRLKMDDHWHTYWKNPGDAGLATSIEWELPEGFVAHGIDWPVPEYHEVFGMASYGYENEIVLPVRIDVPADAEVGRAVSIRAAADWLVCKDICLGGEAKLAMSIKVVANTDQVKPEPQWSELFAWAEKRKPSVLPYTGLNVKTLPSGEFELAIPTGQSLFPAAETAALRFFPDDGEQIAMAGPQEVKVSKSGAVSITLSRNANQSPVERLVGVVVYEVGDDLRAYRVDVPIDTDLKTIDVD